MLIAPKIKERYPMSLEREYSRYLLRYVREEMRIIREFIPLMVDEALFNGIQVDARQDNWISDITDKIKNVVESTLSPTSTLNSLFNKVKTFAKNQERKFFTSIFGAKLKGGSERDYEKLKANWIEENLALIKSIDNRTLEAIRYALSRNMVKSANKTQIINELTETIKQMGEVNEKRAVLIATDQVGKLNSQLTQYEQMKNGVKGYLWRSMRDDRVRAMHEEYDRQSREGKVFSWDKPPEGGHPGWAIRCRCIAVPVYDTDKVGIEPKKGFFTRVKEFFGR